MIFKKTAVLLALALVFSCSGQGLLEDSAAKEGLFEAAPCPVPFPEADSPGHSVKCGFVEVPELHGSPNGRTVRIAVAVFPGMGDPAGSEPLVVAPPGPGTSAIASIGPVVASEVGAALRAFGDVVLIENRGLPLSEPALLCEEVVDAAFDRLQKNLTAEETLDLQLVAVRACWERLQAEGINLDAFNFSEIAADMPMVMTALGYGKFHIYGTSAGTIVAQHVMRNYQDRVSSVIIDSTAPLGRKHLQAENPANGSRAMHALFEACADDPTCARAYPNLESRFDGLIATLNETPVTVTAKDPRTGQALDVVINGDRFAEILFMAAAQTPVIPELPGLIQRLANREYEVLEALSWAAMPPPGQFSHGLGFSAMCSEFNTLTEEDVVFEGRFPHFEKSLANMSWGPRALIKNCATFEVEATGPKTRVATESDIPTLLLTGQFDTMTPPSWTHQAAETLSNSFVYEIPGTGHSATFSGPCPASLALQFRSDPTKEPDASCIGEMKLGFKVPAASSSSSGR